jgi:3-oxoacyl-[acyl-carrier protein] reductase
MKWRGVEMKKLSGKVAFVTGAVGGLGQEQAIALAAAGANVVINYRNKADRAKKAEELIQKLEKEYGGNHIAVAGEVSSESDVEDMISKIIKHYGQIDILVNNAGISINNVTWSFPKEDWDKVLGVNLTGVFLCMKAVLPYMREKRYGRIINMSSVVGITGARGTAAYTATKAAVIGLTKTTAREVATRGITVNCVAPGYINAGVIADVSQDYLDKEVIPTIPMGRLGEASDIAQAVVYLASDDAKYITGEVLRVDGGFCI